VTPLAPHQIITSTFNDTTTKYPYLHRRGCNTNSPHRTDERHLIQQKIWHTRILFVSITHHTPQSAINATYIINKTWTLPSQQQLSRVMRAIFLYTTRDKRQQKNLRTRLTEEGEWWDNPIVRSTHHHKRQQHSRDSLNLNEILDKRRGK